MFAEFHHKSNGGIQMIINTIDTHTAGEPTRILGLQRVVGQPPHENITQLRDWFSKNYDSVRQLLMQEPRGHDNMFGAVLAPSSHPKRDFGLFYFHPKGYLDSCGHATIGIVTALYDLGWFSEPRPIRFETPSGLIYGTPELSNGTVDSVLLRGILPAFIKQTYEKFVVSGKEITAPISYVQAGNTFALIDATTIDIHIQHENINYLREFALILRNRANETVTLTDPFINNPTSVDIVVFYHRQNKVIQTVSVFGDGSVDRSPCGTGVCALLELFHEQGELAVGEELLFKSITNTYFLGALASVESDDSQTTVHGSAHITGFHTFIRTSEDPIDGFTLE